MAKKPPINFDKEFGQRYKEICSLNGTQCDAAALAGLTQTQVYRHIFRKAEPTLLAAYRLCKGAGASLDWLATGDGPKFIETTEAHPKIDSKFFGEVAGFAGEFLEKEGMAGKLSFEGRLRFIVALYNFEMGRAQKAGGVPNLNRDNIIDFMKYHLEFEVA